MLSLLYSMPVVFLIIIISQKISNSFNTNKFFVSIPLIGSLILIIVNQLILLFGSPPLQINPLVERLFVAIFLFSIGFQMALRYKKKHWVRIGILLIICLLLLTTLKLVVYRINDHLTQLVVGPYMFGYNIELLNRFIPSLYHDQFLTIVSIQMLIIFYLTPIFLLLIEKYYPHFLKAEAAKKKEHLIEALWPRFIVLNLIPLFVAVLSLVFKIYMVKEGIPFIFDFVFSMIIGYILGKFVVKKRNSNLDINEIAKQFNNVGTIGLYGFIIAIIYKASSISYSAELIPYILIIIIKTVIVAIVSLLVVRFFFRKFAFHDSLVAIIAGWTFTLSAPVLCMHGMRSVVNKYGPSPDVLLIVPPVILWLVNYVQFLLNLNL